MVKKEGSCVCWRGVIACVGWGQSRVVERGNCDYYVTEVVACGCEEVLGGEIAGIERGC